MKLKVFELRWAGTEEKEWIADYTNIGALITYCLETHTDLLDMDSEDEIIEVPEREWQRMMLIDTECYPKDPDDINAQTVAEWMRDSNQPGIIGGTLYL